MMGDAPSGRLGDRVVERTRREFPASELGTALWLLRECATDAERIEVLIDADGDLTTLVLAVEDRTRLAPSASDARVAVH
jgi:hypothetical protein